MGSLHQNFDYNNGVSYPYHQLLPDDSFYSPLTSNKIYSDSLTSLSRSTDYNLQRIKHKLVKLDPREAYHIVHWRPDDVEKRNKIKELDYPEDAEFPKWEETKSVFGTDTDLYYNNRRSSDVDSSGMVNKLCYLCTTLEEHQRHLARRGVQLKEKKKAKPRIKYIPPIPIVKIVQKEVEEKEEVLYKFAVKTGQFSNAGTCANVTVKLKGSHGIMRKKSLKKKTSGTFSFGRSTTEVFYVKGPDIGQIQMLAIEHDGLEQRHAWFLDLVEVTVVNTDESYLFLCQNWLSLYHGDGVLKKVLKAELMEYEPREFEVSVVTGDKLFAGTDANAYITIYGRKGVSRKLRLKNRSKDNFEKGQKDTFYVTVKENIGKVSKIRLEHDNSGSGPGWLVEQVTVKEDSSGEVLKFPCGKWLATDEDDGQIYRDLIPISRGKGLEEHEFGSHERIGKGKGHGGPVIQYEITVLTGRQRYAGTDARVFMTLHGKRSQSSEFELKDPFKDLFEQGQTDIFQIWSEDVGGIHTLRLRHDNAGLGAGWFVEKITIKRYFPKTEIKERLNKMEHEIDETVARRVSEATGLDLDSPKNRKKLKYGGSKMSLDNIVEEDEENDKRGRKKGIISSSESDDSSSDDITSAFGREKKKKKKKRFSDDSSDSESSINSESDDGVIKRGYRSRKKGKRDEDSESEDESLKKRKRRNKKTKWIQHAGYRIEVTDSEAEKRERKRLGKKKKKKRGKIHDKYPTDSSTDSEDEYRRKNKKKNKKRYKDYGTYYSDSDIDEQLLKKINKKKLRKIKSEESDESENEIIGRKENVKASSKANKNKLPHYDEYVFNCNKWLAKDEGDELIDRKFKPSTVTTFFKMH